MSSIIDAITLLNRFSNQENISPLIAKLHSLNKKLGELDQLSSIAELPNSEEGVDETIRVLHNDLSAILSGLRKDLQGVMSNAQSQSTRAEGLSLYDSCYNCLLALAETYPINYEDCITQEKISAENKVVISTGSQFDIHALVEWFQTQAKEQRFKNLGDFFKAGKCENPMTRQAFSAEDAGHVWQIASEKIPDINKDLSPASTQSDSPDQVGGVPLSPTIEEIISSLRQLFTPIVPPTRPQTFHSTDHAQHFAQGLYDLSEGQSRSRAFRFHKTSHTMFPIPAAATSGLGLAFAIKSDAPRRIELLIQRRQMTASQALNLTDNERNNLGNPAVFSLIERRALSVTEARGLTLEQRDRISNGENLDVVLGRGRPSR